MNGSATVFGDEHEFENEVRRIARLLWPTAQYGGAAMEDNKERDGVFESDEFVHLVECTISRQKYKAEQDSEKLQKLAKRMGARHPTKFVKGSFITLHEPTADQRSVFQKAQGRVVIVSFDQFRAKLIDGRSYLGLRDNYAFGSVRDPETGRATTALDYVPLDILDSTAKLHDVDSICGELLEGRHIVLLGDYGAGKSATMREMYFQLAARFRASKSLRFPVLLNLRDHHGQTEPVEALERHARRVGFAPPESLVRAWRAGMVTLLLDGFDEIATAGWAGKTKRLKDLRYRSMELIRSFVRDTPEATGLGLAGREHFFDGPREMVTALGVSQGFRRYSLSEFSEQQVTVFLGRAGWSEAIPEWVPARPLLLGYLASRNLLQETLEVEAGSGPAAGWNSLLERISGREAEIEPGIDPGTVRRLVEHLATLARNSPGGVGPLPADRIATAFTDVCGYPPDDRGAVLLHRLPGLGGHSAEDGSRVFIDKDFAAAAQGGALFRYIESPFTEKLDAEHWQTALPELGIEVAAYRCAKAEFSSAKITAALDRAVQQQRSDTLCADMCLVLAKRGESYAGPKIFVKDSLIPKLELGASEADLSGIEFQDCIFGHLEYGVESEKSPRFVRCYFGLLEGRAGLRDLPESTFVEPTVEAFENPAQTTNAILGLELPLGTRVVLTILKKLYAQSGSGRRESAFIKGLDPRAQQVVPAAVVLLRRRGFATRTKQGDQIVWLPTKSSTVRKRALGMLASPHTSDDPLILESENI